MKVGQNIRQMPNLLHFFVWIWDLGSTHWISDINKFLKVQEITKTQSELKKNVKLLEIFCEENPITNL